MADDLVSVRWVGAADGQLHLLDQTALPLETRGVVCRDVEAVIEAIKALRVRGAPAIGIAAAYGVCLGLQRASGDQAALAERLARVTADLAASRPTAVNLFWALRRMTNRARDYIVQAESRFSPDGLRSTLLDEARALHEEDRRTCRAIGRHGAELLLDGQGVLTHCNTGGLATSEYGTALGVVFTAQDQGKRVYVYADETRPLLQGARLTTWELRRRNIPVTLICDSMAAEVMRQGRVHAVLVGADRIAANGDTANKIGTYSLAVLAHAHGLPFYVAAPGSTFDLELEAGQEIPIEERAAEEITHGFGKATAPPGVNVYNPAFDVTPARYITAIITEHGLIQPVTRERVLAVLRSADHGAEPPVCEARR